MKKNIIKSKKRIQLRQKNSKIFQDDKEREQREAVMHMDVYTISPRGHRL
jgi:hypothetical protein